MGLRTECLMEMAPVGTGYRRIRGDLVDCESLGIIFLARVAKPLKLQRVGSARLVVVQSTSQLRIV